MPTLNTKSLAISSSGSGGPTLYPKSGKQANGTSSMQPFFCNHKLTSTASSSSSMLMLVFRCQQTCTVVLLLCGCGFV
ncbi:hypothetical protein HUJ04_002274 [Dendroctonus ponderosae]|nr:hypothetical protein HUJ04_002274 [Dendroctonus ponderosae]